MSWWYEVARDHDHPNLTRRECWPGRYCLKCESFKTIRTILIMFVRLLVFIEERWRERESSPPDIIIQLSRVSIESLEVYHRLNPSETLLLQLPGNHERIASPAGLGTSNFLVGGIFLCCTISTQEKHNLLYLCHEPITSTIYIYGNMYRIHNHHQRHRLI